MVAAASGTALALLDQQETLISCGCAARLYRSVAAMLDQVQNTINEVEVKREALRRVLAR